ncbi:MAG TPA: hypothetical protein VH500_18040 [Nitrososphaeraceae archaeon]|jgi:hypothetical protein
MNSIKDEQGNNVLVIYHEEIEALTISKKTKKMRVYCRPKGFFEFRYKKKLLITDNHLRFDEGVSHLELSE